MEWKPSEKDGGKTITQYLIEYKTIGRTTWSSAGSVDASTTKFKATDLFENTEYLFRVIAVNAEGRSVPLEAQDVTKPMRELSKFIYIHIIGYYLYKKLILITIVNQFLVCIRPVLEFPSFLLFVF